LAEQNKEKGNGKKDYKRLLNGEIATKGENTSPRPHFHAFRCLRLLFAVSVLGFCRFIAYTLFSFTEDFSAIFVLSSDVFETYLNQFTGIFSIES
jgi:hypothetical protein